MVTFDDCGSRSHCLAFLFTQIGEGKVQLVSSLRFITCGLTCSLVCVVPVFCLSPVYSAPNCVLPFLGGLLADYVGSGPALITYALCICVGQAMFALGVSSRQLWLMLLGRAVFGLGGESLGVVQSGITSTWFR